MIPTLSLFRPLHQKLISLLISLDREDWAKKTVAGSWTVKDVTAHLLDTTFWGIAMYRDDWMLPPPVVDGHKELVSYLNKLNADWVVAMQRISPALLIELLRHTNEEYIRCLEALDPTAPARFSVAWAGEEISQNWFHVAREYTEQWHHQQQIREAVGKEGILTREYYYPALDTFLQALPFQYRNVNATEGSRVSLIVDTEAGGTWQLEKKSSGWKLVAEIRNAQAVVTVPASLAWKLLTKALRYEDVQNEIKITGDKALAIPSLRLISVMA